jgi:hypothetical protein
MFGLFVGPNQCRPWPATDGKKELHLETWPMITLTMHLIEVLSYECADLDQRCDQVDGGQGVSTKMNENLSGVSKIHQLQYSQNNTKYLHRVQTSKVRSLEIIENTRGGGGRGFAGLSLGELSLKDRKPHLPIMTK